MAEPQIQQTYDSVRIPIYEPSTYNAGRFRSGVNDVNRKYFNCFPVLSKSPLTGEGEVWISKRQGLIAGLDFATVLGAVNSNAMFNLVMTQLNDVFVAAVYDYTNSKIVIIQYRPIAGTAAKIGELTGTTIGDDIFLTELTVAGVPTLGVSYTKADLSTSKGYYATSVASLFPAASLTQIVDVDYPAQLAGKITTGPMLQMNGTTYIMTKDGGIYNSDLNSITSWNALGVINAIQYPDEGCALVRYKNHIVAFGEDSIEFFNDVGTAAPASPLQRLDQAFVKFGAIMPRSIVNVDDTLYWLGRSASGTNGLWRLDGYTPVKISGPDEDANISAVTQFASADFHSGRLWPFAMNATKHLVVGGITPGNGLGIVNGLTFTPDVNSFSTTEVKFGTLCMTLETKEFWYFRQAWTVSGSINVLIPLAANSFQTTQQYSSDQYWLGAFTGSHLDNQGKYTYQIAGAMTNANMSGSESDLANATTVYVTCGFQLTGHDFGTNKRKFIHKIDLIARHSNEFGGTCWFMWNKTQNTGSTTSNQQTINYNNRSFTVTGSSGNLSQRIYVKNLGYARNWTFGVVYKSQDTIAFKALDVDVSLGTD